MKMTHHDREYLLSQIAAVLSDLQCLVSQLSTVQIEENEVSKVKILCQKITAPRSTYHITRPRSYTVDLSKVNVRFLSNIPRPDLYYVHGCPDEAEAAEMEKYKRPRKLNVEYGFMTDHGVVPVPDQPVHGHTWSHHFKRWVLHAVPDDYHHSPPPSRQRGRFRG